MMIERFTPEKWVWGDTVLTVITLALDDSVMWRRVVSRF